MGAIETYNARVGFQKQLDELFSAGSWVTVIEDIGGKLVPSGIEITTGRVFCSDATETPLGWYYQLFIDPRNGDAEVQQWEQPFTAWVAQLDSTSHELYAEALTITEGAEDEFILIRLTFAPQGPRAVAPGQREFVTALREAEMFPRGIEPIELQVVADV